MTVKYHSVNVTITYYRTIVKVLSHYHKDVIVIELSHIILVVLSLFVRDFVFEGILKGIFKYLLMAVSRMKISKISDTFTEVM